TSRVTVGCDSRLASAAFEKLLRLARSQNTFRASSCMDLFLLCSEKISRTFLLKKMNNATGPEPGRSTPAGVTLSPKLLEARPAVRYARTLASTRRFAMRNTFVGLTLFLVTSPAGAADFALRDGDTVVFLGDSITAARTYGKIIENYTLLRFPERKVRFLNAGWGGDTAEGGFKRLERDVFSNGATVLIVAYGINDIGWGLHADEEHKRRYLDAVRGIVTECKKRNVRVFIGSAAVTAADPARTEADFLQT